MSDLISRKKTIDKINERQRKLIYCFGFENDAVKIMDIAKSIVITMPSAQFDRDIPKKPKEIIDSTWGIHKKQAVCPECDCYLGYVVFLGGRKGKRVTYCEHCGQAIDWEGWMFDE